MKITNPAAMRTTYGKLMWMLMDAKDSFAIRALGFDCREEEIFTVYKMLLSRDNNDATSLIKDSLLQQAVLWIDSVGKTREEINAAIKRKNEATEVLKRRYGKAPESDGNNQDSVAALLKDY